MATVSVGSSPKPVKRQKEPRMTRFDGRALLVTGGGSGLGAAVARRFDAEGVAAAVGAARERLGRLDSVVNSAGHVVLSRFEKLSLDDWNRMLAVHVTGTFLVCRAAVPPLREAGDGSIVNISSTGGLVG